MRSNALFALLGGGVVALAVALVGVGYLLAQMGEESPAKATSTSGRLGPQVEIPDPKGETIIATGWRDEVRCAPYSDCEIGHDFGNQGNGCAGASCSYLWTWSVRDPYPLDGPSVEFILLKQGVNQVIASGTAGQAGTGYTSPVRAVNRSSHALLVEFYYILVGKKVLTPTPR